MQCFYFLKNILVSQLDGVFPNRILFISFVCFKLLTNRKASTSSEHHGTFAVFTVVVVFVSGAEAGPVGGQAALLSCCATVTSQIQPEGEETHRRMRSDETNTDLIFSCRQAVFTVHL